MTGRPAGMPADASTVEPLIDVRALAKHYGGESPLRIARLQIGASDRIVLSGLGAPAAETLMHLLTGAALPDEGEVRIDGRTTRDITTDTEWLASLDRFGMVSARAVLFESLPTAASLALPLSLSIDPMPDDVRRQVESLARDAGLALPRLDVKVSDLEPAERLRVHLGRALAHRPTMVFLELPTANVPVPAERQAFGEQLRRASEAMGFGWLAISDDLEFARASGARQVRLGSSGALSSSTRRRWAWFRSS